MAMGSVMGTVSPAPWRIFSMVPETSASMVMVSLSVSISKRGLPAVTVSPSWTSQLRMVPSVIIRPCLGIITIEAMA